MSGKWTSGPLVPAGFLVLTGTNTCWGFGAPESGEPEVKVRATASVREREPFLHHSPVIGIESSPVEETATHQMMAFLFEFQEGVAILSGVIL